MAQVEFTIVGSLEWEFILDDVGYRRLLTISEFGHAKFRCFLPSIVCLLQEVVKEAKQYRVYQGLTLRHIQLAMA